MSRIDLNCDLGEGAGHDAGLMALITSANIACGAHAGDEATMRATVDLAKKHGVAIGAHPGLADRENFGRRELPVSPVEAHGLVLAQTHRFLGITIETPTILSVPRTPGIGQPFGLPVHGCRPLAEEADDSHGQSLVCGEGQALRFMNATQAQGVRLGSGHVALLTQLRVQQRIAAG